MVGVRGGREVVHDSDTRELKILELLFAHEFFRRFGSRTWVLLRGFRSFDLRFHIFTFPAACHAYSVTQIVQIAADSEEKLWREEHQALAARRCGRTGRAGRITPRIEDSATRARCSAKMPP